MKCKCTKCGYEWEPRVADPKACPLCKQYRKKQEISDKIWKKLQTKEGI